MREGKGRGGGWVFIAYDEKHFLVQTIIISQEMPHYIAVCGTFSIIGLFENVINFVYRFILTPSDITVQGGASATLKCSATGVPNPSISWQKDRLV
jgi:hypothetical protein